MATIQCPTCGTHFNSADSNAMPFCGDRCRNIDLGGWLNEEHSIPVDRNPDEESDVPWIETEHSANGVS